MIMRKWLILAVTLTLALGTVGTVTAFALAGDGGNDSADDTNTAGEVPNGGDTVGEVLHGDPTYDEWILDFGDGIGDGKVLHGDPTYEEWLANYQPNQGPVTSIDDIDPNVCNLVHNINACTPEELEETFRALTDIASKETQGRMEPVIGQVVVSSIGEGNPEPSFVDSEPRHTVQSLKEAVEQDCGLAGGTVYVTSEGELGCVIAHNLKDSGEELVSSSQPPTIEPLLAPVTQ